MICPRCSRQLPDNTRFCDGCGFAFNNQPPTYQQPVQFQNPAPQYTYPQSPIANQSVPGKGLGIASLILGIFSLLGSCFFGLNFAVALAGLILGIVGIAQSKKVNYTNGMAVGGLVCSVLALFFGIVISAVFVVIILEETGSLEDFFEFLPYMFEEIFEEIF